jgi:hypothetical protein
MLAVHSGLAHDGYLCASHTETMTAAAGPRSHATQPCAAQKLRLQWPHDDEVSLNFNALATAFLVAH